ncbi:MAG: hypothetical protein LWY06_19820 [Firmicutes bacterium]|nr:hypothetical protein [Bacillota bacterium]
MKQELISDNNIRVDKNMAYSHCRDFGLCLSWGMNPLDIIRQFGRDKDNPLNMILSCSLQDALLNGKSFSAVYARYPEIFGTACVKWIEIGMKYGILDTAFLHLAACIRFGKTILRKEPENDCILAGILSGISELSSRKNKSDRKKVLNKMEKLAKNNIFREFTDYISEKENSDLFRDSTSLFLTNPFFGKIGNPLLWHILEISERGGFIAEIAEILSLTIKDERNLFSEGIISDAQPTEEITSNNKSDAEALFNEICGSTDNTVFIATKTGSSVRFEHLFCTDSDFSERNNENDCFKSIDIKTFNTLKILLGLDPLENRLTQQVFPKLETKSGTKRYSICVNHTCPEESGPAGLSGSIEEWNIKPLSCSENSSAREKYDSEQQ